MPKPSELSISDRPGPALSGLAISFGKTFAYLPNKTVTRRCWKDSHAQKFTNAFHQNKLVKALDKDIRYGGKQIGWCRLLCPPYKQQLSAMPDADLLAEGGMCESVEAFIHQYFKGDGNLAVWVIRFEFIAADKQVKIPTLDSLGICSNSATKGDGNSTIISSIDSIHQAQLSAFGVYSAATNKTDRNSFITSATDSIHQVSLTPLGVYSAIQYKTNSNFPISLSIDSIHQGELEHQIALGIYQINGNQINSNTAISFLVESIHQEPVLQGGNGLVYSFWKGESIVNHYRYKVKVNGKWKVRSIYIPVGKLPKVREAITNNVGVVMIVVEILGKKLEE